MKGGERADKKTEQDKTGDDRGTLYADRRWQETNGTTGAMEIRERKKAKADRCRLWHLGQYYINQTLWKGEVGINYCQQLKDNTDQLSNHLLGIYITLACHQRKDREYVCCVCTTSLWATIHKGTICTHWMDVVHCFRSVFRTCQSNQSAISAPTAQIYHHRGGWGSGDSRRKWWGAGE